MNANEGKTPELPISLEEFGSLLARAGVADLDEAAIRRHIELGYVPIDDGTIDLVGYLAWLLNDGKPQAAGHPAHAG